MKQCIFCLKEKELSEFSMRKRPPIKPYAACKDCESIAYNRKPNKDYQSEVKDLREKAIELRKFTPEQDLAIARRVASGEFKNAIAKEFGVSDSAVAGAAKRGKAMM